MASPRVTTALVFAAALLASCLAVLALRVVTSRGTPRSHLEVRCARDGARVLVDGRDSGPAPAVLEGLPPEKVHVEVRVRSQTIAEHEVDLGRHALVIIEIGSPD